MRELHDVLTSPHPGAPAAPQMRWTPVTDTRGRTVLECRWVPAQDAAVTTGLPTGPPTADPVAVDTTRSHAA